MNNYLDQIRDVFFINNGEIDLLTGSSAPNLFNQLVKRDIQLADRYDTQLSIISLNVCLDRFVLALGQENLKLDLEEALIKTFFELKQIFRDSDCISRVSQLGFWILVTGLNENSSENMLSRISQLIPTYFDLSICHRQADQNQLDWYSKIDEMHFKSNIM
jgi:hypothetical protein